jgi:hypothetical protein
MVATSYEGTPRAVRIKRFLMREPQPHSAVGVNGEGDKKSVKIVAGSRYKWSDATKLLYDCHTVTALDQQGKELRILPIGPDDDADLHEDAATERSSNIMTEFRAVMAKEVTGLVREIARSMVEVADHAASRHEAHMTTAFNALVAIVQTQSQLAGDSMRQVNALQRALTAAATGGAPQSEESMTQSLVMSLLNGGLGGGGAPHAGNGGPSIQLSPDVLQSLAARFMGGGGGGAPSPVQTVEPDPATEQDEE